VVVTAPSWRRARPRDRLEPDARPRTRLLGSRRQKSLRFISIKTVETHVSAALRKLQLSSRHELTARALERKLL
jgi:hypothetical protein